MKWFLALLGCACLSAADVPHLYFSKSFPGSAPAFVAINVDRSGAGDYREDEKDDNPVHFQLNDTETAALFDLAAKVGYFNHPLESPLKVAFMGTKTLRFIEGAKTQEVKFNFSEDLSAQALLDNFERICESEQLLTNLEVSAKYDHLGVMKALVQLESAYDRKRIVDTSQFLPLLDRIAKNEVYMHQARALADSMAQAFRNPPAPK